MQLLRIALALVVLGLVASLLGFGAIAGLSDDVAKLLVIVAVALFLISLATGGKKDTET